MRSSRPGNWGTSWNEITAIPKLLDLLTIKGATITIDAIGCQREIAAKIIEKEAHYVLALKGNQGTLRDAAETFVVEQKACKFADCVANVAETIEKSHGRIETRIVTAIGDIGWLQERHDWPGLISIVVVESRREMADRCESESRFYISSRAPLARQLGETVGGHWGIENGLHWVMDMVFRDDECRTRKNNTPANFATMKHVASNVLRKAPGKDIGTDRVGDGDQLAIPIDTAAPFLPIAQRSDR